MADENDIVGNEVFPLPVKVYGRSDCEQTALARQRLEELRIPFIEINIEEDEQAAAYVENVNHGERKTPTIVFGNDELIIVEPTRHELDQALIRAGYEF